LKKSGTKDEITKLESGLKRAEGTVKMKLVKAFVSKMGCLERPIYYLSSKGENFIQVPNRDFFRKNYDRLDVQFDYHVKFQVSEDEENNMFKFKVKIFFDEDHLADLDVIIGFSGGEFSGKLNAKYKFDLPANFNYLVSKIDEEI